MSKDLMNNYLKLSERFKNAKAEARSAISHKEIVETNSFAVVENRKNKIEAVTTPFGDIVIQIILSSIGFSIYFPLKICKAVFDYFMSWGGPVNLKYLENGEWQDIPSEDTENAMNWYKYFLSCHLLPGTLRNEQSIDPKLIEQHEDFHERSIVNNTVWLIIGIFMVFGGLFVSLVWPEAVIAILLTPFKG